jgi:hypothetical protein
MLVAAKLRTFAEGSLGADRALRDPAVHLDAFSVIVWWTV